MKGRIVYRQGRTKRLGTTGWVEIEGMVPKLADQHCETCRYWEKNPKAPRGYCHPFPGRRLPNELACIHHKPKL